MIIAINIETNLWNKIIALLIRDQWVVTYKYDNIDAGIDFDFIILAKNGEEVILGWDNWVEGEVKCSESTMARIENMIGIKLEKGQPVNLKPAVINLYRKQDS